MLDLQAKSSFRITEDSTFFTKLLSKERNAAESSFRVCGSIPFTWELRPGTPKNVLSHSSLSLPPPLTPPPSYNHCYTINHRRKTAGKKFPRSNLFNAFLMRISLKRIKNGSSSSASASSSSSSSSSHDRSSLASSSDSDADIDQSTTALCFKIAKA